MRRRMKRQIAGRDAAAQRHTERLNRAIEVLVINRILIMPDARAWVGYLVANDPDAVVARVWLDLIEGRSSPGIDGRHRSDGGANC